MKYSSERDNIAEAIYRDLFTVQTSIKRNEINKAEQPVSLYAAYGEYHYGVFSTDMNQ